MTDQPLLPPPRSLPRPLQCLFALNGATLALPTVALLSLVQQTLPLEHIPLYATLAFLPFGLKPLYAQTSRQLLAPLLLLQALALLATLWTTSIPCFLALAFVRGLVFAWPEFLVGWTLVEECCGNGPAAWQAQAATARNAGSAVAHLLGLVLYALEESTTAVMLVTALGSLVAAGVAAWYQVGYDKVSMEEEAIVDDEPRLGLDHRDEEEASDEESPLLDEPSIATYTSDSVEPEDTPEDTSTSFCTSPLVWLQLALLCLALAPTQRWFLGTALATGIATASTLPRVGLFLLAKHAVPSIDYLLDLSLLSHYHSPWLVQVWTVWSTLVSLAASATYVRIWSKTPTVRVLCYTQVLAGVAVVLYLPLLLLHNHQHYWILLVVRTLDVWTTEWNLLPSVVLATEASDSNARSYGQWLACLDWGSQVGTLLLGPLMGVCGVHDMNSGLGGLVAFVGVWTVLSTGWVGLLGRR